MNWWKRLANFKHWLVYAFTAMLLAAGSWYVSVPFSVAFSMIGGCLLFVALFSAICEFN